MKLLLDLFTRKHSVRPVEWVSFKKKWNDNKIKVSIKKVKTRIEKLI